MNKITSVCVYCASSTKIDSAYFEDARQLGTLLGQRHIRLINGAGGIGLVRGHCRRRAGCRRRSDRCHPPLHGGAGLAPQGIDGDDRSGRYAPAQTEDGGFE